MPGRRINGFDLLATNEAKETLVLANVDIRSGQPWRGITVADRSIVLVNGLDAPPAAVVGTMARLRSTLAADDLTAVPMAILR